jgi:uncharacterized protein (TIGR00661 family)
VRILYGVNGEGMGHATRSEVVIEDLLCDHEVKVMAAGAAFRYLSGRLGNVNEIFGPSFAMEQGEIRRWATVRHTVASLGRELPSSVHRWMHAVAQWRPDAVVCDFEPLSGIYARWARVALVCVDNIHMVDRCRHDPEILEGAREDFRIARAVTHAMVPTAGDYVIPTFFRPPLLRGRTDLVPPIVRSAVVDAEPVRGDHLLVYSDGSDALLGALHDTGIPCRVYAMRDGPTEDQVDGAITFRPRSVDGFLADLASCRGVIAGGGFSLISETVFLRKPMMCSPLRGQFEQLMNARYLEREGYGICAEAMDERSLERFLERLDEIQERLDGYEQDGNKEALDVIRQRVTDAGAATRRDRATARRKARVKQR